MQLFELKRVHRRLCTSRGPYPRRQSKPLHIAKAMQALRVQGPARKNGGFIKFFLPQKPFAHRSLRATQRCVPFGKWLLGSRQTLGTSPRV